MAKKESYQEYLINSLKDPEEAAGYLNAALEGGNIQVFLLALHNVVQAQGGIRKLSENTHKSRTSLYKALSRKGNPYLESTGAATTVPAKAIVTPSATATETASTQSPMSTMSTSESTSNSLSNVNPHMNNNYYLLSLIPFILASIII